MYHSLELSLVVCGALAPVEVVSPFNQTSILIPKYICACSYLLGAAPVKL